MEDSRRRHTIHDRIVANIKVNRQTGCWEWQGGDSGKGSGGGYARMSLNGRTVAVHLVMYTHYYGYIPGKKQIDHLCVNRCCVNPDHLELVSPKENARRRDFNIKKMEVENEACM